MTAYTKHAAARAQQRALPPMVDFLLDEFGQRSHDGRGAVRVYFTHESVRRMERAFGRRPVAKMSEYLNAYRVDDSRDGTTITIGHRSQRMRRG